MSDCADRKRLRCKCAQAAINYVTFCSAFNRVHVALIGLKPALKRRANLVEWQEKLTLTPTRGQVVSRRLLSWMSATDPQCQSLDKHKNHLQKLRFSITKLAEKFCSSKIRKLWSTQWSESWGIVKEDSFIRGKQKTTSHVVFTQIKQMTIDETHSIYFNVSGYLARSVRLYIIRLHKSVSALCHCFKCWCKWWNH